jgi:hypothetical protein
VKPLAIDLFCGLGGWAEGFLSEGYDVIGFDIEARPYPGQLVLQDVLTLDGWQFRDVDAIVASPPCQKYSYMAMPWKRAKELAAWYREFPFGRPRQEELNRLFNACFRIQREASEAAGREIPMVVENVKGAQPWVGRAKWHYGSFYLWGDVPALMPFARSQAKISGQDWNRFKNNGEVSPHWRLQHDGHKAAGAPQSSWFGISHGKELAKNGGNPVRQSTKTAIRREKSAEIAMIPPPLAQWIARCFLPADAPTREAVNH